MPHSKTRANESHKPAAVLAMVGTPAYYENIIRTDPRDQKAYERLMVLYRQQKDYKRELATINKAIKIFEPLYATPKSKDKKVNVISGQLNRALGLVDKKGRPLFEQKPLSTWRKRKETVLKKIKA
jgi:tetratricopeptide (TPR) repeat protein